MKEVPTYLQLVQHVGQAHAASSTKLRQFQSIEAGIFVALALALLGFSIWWIRKRIS